MITCLIISLESAQIELDIQQSMVQLDQLKLTNQSLENELHLAKSESNQFDKNQSYLDLSVQSELGASDLFSPVEHLLNRKVNPKYYDQDGNNNQIDRQIVNL